MQKWVTIGDIDVPIIIDKGVTYYPISYITTKVLLRSGKSSLVGKHNISDLNMYVDKYIIKFSEHNIQESNCINEYGLVLVLSATRQGRLSLEQKRSQNNLHKHLGIDLLSLNKRIIDSINEKELNKHDDYTKEVILFDIECHKYKFQLCNKCNKYYPLFSKYFCIDNRVSEGFNQVCRICSGKISMLKHENKDLYNMRQAGENLYMALKEDNIYKIYESYLNGDINRLPDCYINKDDYLRIIRHLLKFDKLNKSNITITMLINDFKLFGIGNFYNTNNELLFELFGEECKLKPYIYKTYNIGRDGHSLEQIKLIFDMFLYENNIKIKDIFTFKYGEVILKARVRTKNLLSFIVWYYNYQYAGYLFKTKSSNYYKKDDNVLFDLRYLIEEDMKLKIDKIPLYLTKNVLQKKCNPLYNYIITKGNGTIFEWVNRLYPDKFIEADFEINAYRNEFDSDTECFIHEILCDKFGSNVLYNPKHTDRTVTLNGMIPDWIVINENGTYIIEYFGMYAKRQYGKSSRVTDYIDKTHRKIEKYNQMKNFNYVFLYPKDIEDDFKGCREKIEKIK